MSETIGAWVGQEAHFLKGGFMCFEGAKRRELPSFITLQWLKDEGARCKDALQWFERAFPYGANIVDALTQCTNRDWIFWLLYRR